MRPNVLTVFMSWSLEDAPRAENHGGGQCSAGRVTGRLSRRTDAGETAAPLKRDCGKGPSGTLLKCRPRFNSLGRGDWDSAFLASLLLLLRAWTMVPAPGSNTGGLRCTPGGLQSQSGSSFRGALPSPGGGELLCDPLSTATWDSSGDPPRSRFPFLTMEDSRFPRRSPAIKQELLYLRPF